MTAAEFQMLEHVAQGQEALGARFEALEKAFAVHCALEEASAKRRSNRIPMLASLASCVAAAVALATLFLR